MTCVDIAGNFEVFATFSVTLHAVDFVGATKREETMEHGPDSDHVFLPFETVLTNQDNGVFDFFATVVFITAKPGRTAIGAEDVALSTPAACDDTEYVYVAPFTSPVTTHVVEVVVQTVVPVDDVTTYVTGAVLVTADHVIVTDLLDTIADISVGATGATGATDTGGATVTTGGATGVTVVVLATPTPSALDPMTEIVYVVPFDNPEMVHDPTEAAVHELFPGVAVATYVAPCCAFCQDTSAAPSRARAESC